MYKYIKPALFKIDPETVHDLALSTGEFLGKNYLGRFITNVLYGRAPQQAFKKVDNITYTSPVILSAGFDYDGRLTRILPYLGFGGMEIGSTTALPCRGNNGKHLTRLPGDKSILVNKGLKNKGVDILIDKLINIPREPNFVIGISIARTNCLESSTIQSGINDYVYSLKKLSNKNIGDYYTINISCPNSHTGETFASPNLDNKGPKIKIDARIFLTTS